MDRESISRREFIKYTSSAGLGFSLSVTRPNILFIFSDQHRGNGKYDTLLK